MLSQTDAVKQAWAAADRTLDIIVTVDGKDYQATEINSLNYDAGAFTGDTLGIGSTYENSVTIEFSSVVEAFKQGLTVLPKVGILVNGKFEYTKLGTFIISEVNRDRNNNLTTIKALDQMCKLEGQYKPTVEDMANPLAIIADIANQGGVTINANDLLHFPELTNIKRIERQTLRTAIGWVAQLYGGFAAFDRDGKLTIRTTATPDYTITPGEYQQGGLTKNEVAYKTGGIKVTVNTKKTDDSGQEVDDTTTLQAGETTGSQIELTNDSMTSDLLTRVWTGIKDITYYPYTLNWFGNPGIEAGDWVTLTDTQGNQFNVPINQYTMSFNGGLESTISATQTSSAAGGYAYTGSAGSIKNMIEALQVRHTASGNNVYPPSYQGQPQNPKKGDVWYKQNGNNVEVWIYQEEDGKLSWVRTPLDGEVKAELQAMGKKTDEDLTKVKSELSSEAENQWQSMKTATSETDQRLTSLQAENNKSLADLHDTADSLHAAANSLHADADSMRSSLASATSETASELASTRNSLAAVDADLRNGVKQAGNDLSAATSELQRKTGQLSGSLSMADSMIMFNSNAIAEVKRTAGEISTTVSNIRVGGRNLLRNSDKLPYSGNGYSFWSTGQWRIAGNAVDADNMKRTNKEITDPPQGDKVTGISFTGILQPSVSDISLVAIDDVPVSGNVTVSFWARQTSNVDTAFVSANWGYGRPANVVNTNASTEIWGTASYPYRKLFLPKDGSWTRFWATFNVNDKDSVYIGAGNTGTSAEVQICLVKIETGTMATDWTPAPEDTDQAISKISQTADTIRADLTNTKGDVASVKATANSLTTSMANANDQISTLQQRADSITSTLSNGGVNLLNNSQGNFQPKNSAISNWQTFQGVDVYMMQGKKYTVSAQAAPGFVFSGTHDATAESNRITLWLTDLPNNNLWQMISSDTTDVSQGGTHFTWNHASGTYTLCVNSYKKDNSGYAYHVQIEYGDTATPWQPSNGDISSLQQTAQGLTADMKDAKGNISSLQATAGGLTTRVANAEHNVSSLQQTADRLSGVVGDANSGLVSSVNAIPGQISSAITASKQATVITWAVDLHNMTTAGYYLLKGALTNSPVDAWAFLRVITSDSGDRIYHRIWKDNASTVYTEEWTGNWSGWATHINSDNLKSNVITAINQSTEGVSITGNKITLDGNVNVAPGFTLTADHIKAGTMSADRISGGTLNFSNITVNGLTANSISSGSISGRNLNINLDNGVVEFTKGNLHSTDGGFNISIDTKSFFLDMGNNTKLWIDGNGYHLQESASQHLWMNKDGLHNYTDSNGNGLWINDTTLKILNSSNAGLVAKDGILQFSANPIWNSDNVYSGTLDSQTYGTIGFNSNLFSSSLNGIFIRGREGVVMGTNSYNGGSMLFPNDIIPSVGGAGINLPEGADNPASIFTNSVLTLYGGSRYYDGIFNDQMPYISIGCNWYYTHSRTYMAREGTSDRNAQMYAKAKTISFDAMDWINLRSQGGAGRIAFDAQYVHSYPTYIQTTSAGANVYVADDGALVRSSSARKYKTDIQDADNDYGAKLIEFAPQKWIDKAEKKRYEEDPDTSKKPGYYYGLIADDLDAAGLDMLVSYGAEGEVEGINYDRLAVALLPVIKSLKDQVASLQKQIKALTK